MDLGFVDSLLQGLEVMERSRKKVDQFKTFTKGATPNGLGAELQLYRYELECLNVRSCSEPDANDRAMPTVVFTKSVNQAGVEAATVASGRFVRP